MTSTIALIERLLEMAKGIDFTENPCRTAKEAATELTTLLERCEKAEAENIIAPAECSNCDDPDCPYSHKPLTLRAAYENCLSRLRSAERENETLTKAGIIEVAVRNPSVMDYMKHWEDRVEKAEAALKREEAHSQELGDKIDEAESFIILIADHNKELERQRDKALKALQAAREQTKEECADFVKHWLIESDNEYAVEVAVECSHALLKWDGKS